MSDDLPFDIHSDEQILTAMRLESRGLRMAIAAIDETAAAMAADSSGETTRIPFAAD